MNNASESGVSGVEIPGTDKSMCAYLGIDPEQVDYIEPTRGWLFAEDCLDFPRVASYFKNREKILRIRDPDEMEDTKLVECYELMTPAFDRGASEPVITSVGCWTNERPVFLAYVKGSPEKTSEFAQLLRGMLPDGAQVGVAIGDGHNLNQVSEFMKWAEVNEFAPLVIGSELYPYRHVVLPRLPYKENGWYHLHDPFRHELDVGAMRNVKGRVTCSWII